MDNQPTRTDQSSDHDSLRLVDMSAGYGDRVVLSELSLVLPLHRVIVIGGPGGSGKSTLLRILTGWSGSNFWSRGQLYLPSGTSFQIQPQGRAPEDSSLTSLLAPGVQESRDEKARRNIDRVWAGHPEAAEALRSALTTDLSSAAPWSRSLARFTGTLAQKAQVHILDEPDADIPPEIRSWMIDRLSSWNGTSTVVLVSHNLQLARRGSDFMVLIVDGKLIESGPTAAFFANPQTERAREYVTLGS